MAKPNTQAITVIRRKKPPVANSCPIHDVRDTRSMQLEVIHRQIARQKEILDNLIYDVKRGAWGAEAESALGSAEDSLSNVLDQIQFILGRRG